MELLFILALIGIAYCVYSNSPPVARLAEVATVAATIALVAYAQRTGQPLAISLPFSVLAAAPLWLICYKFRTTIMAREQRVSASTAQLWQDWDSAKNTRREPVMLANESLAQRLQQAKAQRTRPAASANSPTSDATTNSAVPSRNRAEPTFNDAAIEKLPNAKLRKLNSLPPKAANGSIKKRAAVTRSAQQLDDLELAPMDNCRYKRRL